MNTIITIKQLAASSAIAGSLGLAALGFGSGFAAAEPSTDSGSGTASASSTSSASDTSTTSGTSTSSGTTSESGTATTSDTSTTVGSSASTATANSGDNNTATKGNFTYTYFVGVDNNGHMYGGDSPKYPTK